MRWMMVLLLGTVVEGASLGAFAERESPAHAIERGANLVKHEVMDRTSDDWDVRTVELQPGAGDAPPYQIRGGQLVFVLEGAGRLEAPGKPSVPLSPGSIVTVESRVESLLKNDSPTKRLKVLVLFQVGKGRQAPSSADHPLKSRQPSKSPELGLIF